MKGGGDIGLWGVFVLIVVILNRYIYFIIFNVLFKKKIIVILEMIWI